MPSIEKATPEAFLRWLEENEPAAYARLQANPALRDVAVRAYLRSRRAHPDVQGRLQRLLQALAGLFGGYFMDVAVVELGGTSFIDIHVYRSPADQPHAVEATQRHVYIRVGAWVAQGVPVGPLTVSAPHEREAGAEGPTGPRRYVTTAAGLPALEEALDYALTWLAEHAADIRGDDVAVTEQGARALIHSAGSAAAAAAWLAPSERRWLEAHTSMSPATALLEMSGIEAARAAEAAASARRAAKQAEREAAATKATTEPEPGPKRVRRR